MERAKTSCCLRGRLRLFRFESGDIQARRRFSRPSREGASEEIDLAWPGKARQEGPEASISRMNERSGHLACTAACASTAFTSMLAVARLCPCIETPFATPYAQGAQRRQRRSQRYVLEYPSLRPLLHNNAAPSFPDWPVQLIDRNKPEPALTDAARVLEPTSGRPELRQIWSTSTESRPVAASTPAHQWH